MGKSSRFERARCARIVCVQTMYQILMRAQTQTAVMRDILEFRIKQYQDYEYMADTKLITHIINGYFDNTDTVQSFMTSCLQEGWTLDKMDRVTQAILMSAASELLLPESATPPPVIISEYIDIAKGFLNGNDYLFINKSLDAFAHGLGKKMKKSV